MTAIQDLHPSEKPVCLPRWEGKLRLEAGPGFLFEAPDAPAAGHSRVVVGGARLVELSSFRPPNRGRSKRLFVAPLEHGGFSLKWMDEDVAIRQRIAPGPADQAG